METQEKVTVYNEFVSVVPTGKFVALHEEIEDLCKDAKLNLDSDDADYLREMLEGFIEQGEKTLAMLTDIVENHTCGNPADPSAEIKVVIKGTPSKA